MILRRYPMNITQIEKKEFVFILVHTFGAEKLLCQAKGFFRPFPRGYFQGEMAWLEEIFLSTYRGTISWRFTFRLYSVEKSQGIFFRLFSNFRGLHELRPLVLFKIFANFN